jgi:sulfur carrier protein ThiS
MQVIVNGTPQPLPDGATVAQLLEHMALAGKIVVAVGGG